MRNRIRVLLKSDAPLSISEGFKGGWTVSTKEYIPGAVVRGAIAGHLINSIGEEEMKKILLAPGTAVLDFHPIDIDKINQRKKEKSLDARIAKIIETGRLPQTVISCKRRPGFDSLETLLLHVLNMDKRKKNAQIDLRCETCQERQKQFQGWYQLEEKENENGENYLFFRGVTPATTSYIHIGIDTDRGTATQGIFYTIDALDEEQYFLGAIMVDDNPDEWTNNLKHGEYLFLGGSKSRGYGASRIEVVRIESEKTTGNCNLLESPEIRCQKCTQRIRDKGGFIEEGSWLVPLTLLSPSILMDRFLRPVVDDITKDVRDHGLPITGKPILVKAKCQTIQGWHSAGNVPKPDFLAIASGSVFVYQCPAGKQTVQALHRIENMGIGFRRAEGFGQVRVASSLHAGILTR